MQLLTLLSFSNDEKTTFVQLVIPSLVKVRLVLLYSLFCYLFRNEIDEYFLGYFRFLECFLWIFFSKDKCHRKTKYSYYVFLFSYSPSSKSCSPFPQFMVSIPNHPPEAASINRAPICYRNSTCEPPFSTLLLFAESQSVSNPPTQTQSTLPLLLQFNNLFAA